MAQLPHHGIEERQHERNCGDAYALDENEDHAGNNSTERAKLSARGFKGMEGFCRSRSVDSVDVMTVAWN